MAETLLSIDAVTLAGEDVTVYPVRWFGWGEPDGSESALLTLNVSRAINDLSPSVVGLLISAEPRAATLTCTDDGGVLRLVLKLTGARVMSYLVRGDGVDVTEELTLEATSVEMTCGSSFQVVG